MKIRFLRFLSRTIFGAVFSVERSLPGVEHYLEDLWTDVPKSVALSQTFLALLITLLPLFYWGYLRPFPLLNSEKKIQFLSLLQSSRFYLLRLSVNSLRGFALLAALRDPKTRETFLGC